MTKKINDYKKFLKTAINVSREAGNLILKNLGKISKTKIKIKKPSDFVTHIDKKSEELIINTIKKEFPDHHFLAEEIIHDNETKGYRWIIDPLDGTTNYIHQYPTFSVSIALQEEGKTILGVIYDPVKEELFTAITSCGSYLNKKPINVSKRTNLKESLIITGFPFRKKDIIDDYLKLFKNLFLKVSDIRRDGSAALDLAYVACGRCDGFFELNLSPWDIAAGSILIKEAGGVVTDFNGNNKFLLTGNIIAGNKNIHQKILKEVKSIFKEDI
jgi:myo-inositol-1(or 4)-monophosphatase